MRKEFSLKEENRALQNQVEQLKSELELVESYVSVYEDGYDSRTLSQAYYKKKKEHTELLERYTYIKLQLETENGRLKSKLASTMAKLED